MFWHSSGVTAMKRSACSAPSILEAFEACRRRFHCEKVHICAYAGESFGIGVDYGYVLVVACKQPCEVCSYGVSASD